MAIRIQQYNTGPRQISVGAIDPGYQQPRIGNVAATAENQLAGTLLEAGKALTNVAIKEYVSTETTRVSQSLLAMQKDLSAERDRYMATNQGQNALDAGRHFETFARETARKYMQDGKFNGRFAEMFQKQAAGTALHFTEQGQAYGRQQEALWRDSTYKSSLQEKLNDIAQNYNNPEFLKFTSDNFDEMVDGMFPGMDNRARKLEFRKAGAGSVIEGFLSHGDLKGAQNALIQYRGFLGDDINKYELAIMNERKRREAEARAEQERARAAQERAQNQAAEQLGVEWFQTYGLDGRGIDQELDKVKDPVLRAKALRSYSTQRALYAAFEEQKKDAEKTEAYNNGLSQLNTVLKDNNLTYEEKQKSIADILGSIPNKEARKQAYDDVQFMINGIEAPVNDSIWAEAQMYAAQPGVTPDMVTARFMGALPPSYLVKARKSSQDQQWKQEEQQVQQYAFAYMRKEFNYTDKQCQEMYRLLLPQLNGIVGYEQRIKQLPTLIARVNIKRPGEYWGTDDKTVPAFSVDYYKSQGWREEATQQVKRFRYNPQTKGLEEQ